MRVSQAGHEATTADDFPADRARAQLTSQRVERESADGSADAAGADLGAAARTVPPQLRNLPRDVLQEVLCFPDFASAVDLARILVVACQASSSPSRLIGSTEGSSSSSLGKLPHPSSDSSSASSPPSSIDAAVAQAYEPTWWEHFRRMGFAPDNRERAGYLRPERNVVEEILHRRRLREGWSLASSSAVGTGGLRPRRSAGSLSLPAVCFSWIPLRRPMPDDDFLLLPDDGFCDYCLLLAPTSSECLILDPYTGQLAHHPYGWEHDGGTLPRRTSTDFVAAPRRRWRQQQRGDKSYPASTAASVQILLEGDRAINFDEYLPSSLPTGAQADDGCVESVGMETFPTRDNGRLFVGHARTISVLWGGECYEVTEVNTWERPPGESALRNQRRCRIRHPWASMEVDADRHLLYVATERGETPEFEEPSTMNTCILVYPLLLVDETAGADGNGDDLESGQSPSPLRWEPAPVKSIDCGATVHASCIVRWDYCGNDKDDDDSLLLGTSDGEIQWYRHFRLEHSASVSACLADAMRNHRRSLPVLDSAARAPIRELRVAPYCAGTAGRRRPDFFTLHHHVDSGSTVLLWTEHRTSHLEEDGASSTAGRATTGTKMNRPAPAPAPFRIEEAVHLPLSPRRVPQIHFDGHLLVVYGQDHIGFVVLVYAKSSPDDGDFRTSSSSSSPPSGDGSGGVQNLSASWHLVRTIRHAALGGHLWHEPLHLACNERYAVFNTKLGHLLADIDGDDKGGNNGSAPQAGLLVIDFEEAAD